MYMRGFFVAPSMLRLLVTDKSPDTRRETRRVPLETIALMPVDKHGMLLLALLRIEAKAITVFRRREHEWIDRRPPFILKFVCTEFTA